VINQAVILAAGKGTRMLEMTKDIAKPMIAVCGRSLIYRIIDQLLDCGVRKIVINTFYQAEKLEEHIRLYDRNIKELQITLVRENELLETGGGILNMLPYLSKEPFFVANGDALWHGVNVFSYLNEHWSSNMKALFLLFDKSHVFGYRGNGDFSLGKQNQILSDNASNKEYVYAGAHVTTFDNFDGIDIHFMKLMNIYKDFNKMYGAVLSNAHFLHVGDKQAYAEAEEFLRDK
jgi:N-acetyl-alpha-D-muramate 1-phosphate uridylyltransferase